MVYFGLCRKWSFTFVSTVSKFLKKSYSFLNLRLYLVMVEASAIINIFFTVVKLFSLIKFLMQTAIMGAFPASFTVTDLWHHLTDSIMSMAFCKFSFDSLLDGLTKEEM